MSYLTKLVVFCLSVTIVSGSQQSLRHESDSGGYWSLPNEIRRVAVIGAGPAGLIFTSTLMKHGFQVRMFERAPNPGGVWHYTERVPIPASFPNRPIETMGYIPDVPDILPATRIYEDGDDGLTVDWRIREHWSPSPIWRNMMTTEPRQVMSLPDVGYPKNTPWKLRQMDVNRHVRQYASSVGLNANDDDHTNATAYWTRVERAEKIPGTERRWTVTLRKLTPLRDGTLEVSWWQEEFDAIVIGNDSQKDAAWVPSIPGLNEWANTLPEDLFHSGQYRHPEDFAGKNVLIIGGGFSGVGIANDLITHARSVTVSARNNSWNPLIPAIRGMFHKNITLVSEVKRFENQPSQKTQELRDALLILANGTAISGFDTIMLASGYRHSLPYLVGYHNSTIRGRDEPETKIAPIVTDGTHLRSLHWTGHYIDDPTLLICTGEAWRGGGADIQAIGAARVWSGTARLPNSLAMWKAYPGAAHILQELPLVGQIKDRLFVAWLNQEILEFGGSMVSPAPFEEMLEQFQYYVSKQYPAEVGPLFQGPIRGQLPRREWGIYAGNEADASHRSLTRHQLMETHGNRPPEHWAEPSLRW
ncbi:FAD/NAD(P)-binding domain-containing protein [Clavulina sp. PMI_390]|nr:FAD/NAD(P)-binding domain-containing protein [Clavulina sp. PMI_390]